MTGDEKNDKDFNWDGQPPARGDNSDVVYDTDGNQHVVAKDD